MNIHEKNYLDEKNEKYEKIEKNYIKMFNIDKNEAINITNLDKIMIDPLIIKHVKKIDNFLKTT